MIRMPFAAGAGRPLAVVSVLAAASILVFASVAFAAPGNNGTIKVAPVGVEDLRDNEPHVACGFEVEFFGFDEDAFVDVFVELVKERTTVYSAHGVGAPTDGRHVIDLAGALDSYDPHPKQGYHLRVTVNATHSNGSDAKTKVFWVTDCAAPPPPPTTTTTTFPGYL